MICTRCENIGNPVLYRCLDCYDDGNDQDCDMCESCRDDHIEANFDNETRFEVLKE